jgi:16S rRNA (guanine527-N7)-methyltransferase
VKHLNDDSAAKLRALCSEAGIELDDSALGLMVAYLDAIIEKNRSVNLTRISEPREALRLHLVDSLLALPEVSISLEGTLLDLGTGGGFPGAPLCIASKRRGILLDSIGKKVTAVNEVLAAVGLAGQVEAIASRAEELSHSGGQRFSVVTARAVSSLASLLELASPILEPGGVLIALKGVPTSEEVNAARAVAPLVGMAERSVRECVVPGGDERRTLIAYEKRGPGTIKLPRRIGLAQKSPLA